MKLFKKWFTVAEFASEAKRTKQWAYSHIRAGNVKTKRFTATGKGRGVHYVSRAEVKRIKALLASGQPLGREASA